MKISHVRQLLKNKEVIEEINRHLWIESQKAGYSIGIERATDEWLRLYSEGWIKYHMPEKYNALQGKKKKTQGKGKKSSKTKKTKVKKKAAKKRTAKKIKKKSSARK